MTTLDDLLSPLTRAEVEDSIYTAIEARGLGTTTWKAGAVTRTIITAVALVLSALSYLMAQIARMGFLEYSSGDWLTLVARHVYGVERVAGTFAAGDVILDNSGGGVFTLAVGDLVVKNPTSGKTYRNTAAFTLGAGQTGLVVAVEAIELGSASTAAPATVTGFETPLIGVTVTNPAALVGLDEESDAQLRYRCAAKLGSLSPNGPWDAYYYRAVSATLDDGTPAGVTRVAVVPDGVGGVDVYVATASGTVTGTVGDTTTALGAVDEAIQSQVVPVCITASTRVASIADVTVVYAVWARSSIGITEAELRDRINAALAQYIGSVTIGGLHKGADAQGYLFTDGIAAAIADAVGVEHLIDLDLSQPAADVPLQPDEAPVLVGTGSAISVGGS